MDYFSVGRLAFPYYIKEYSYSYVKKLFLPGSSEVKKIF